MDYSSIFAVRANRYRDAQARFPGIRRAELERFVALLALQGNECVLGAPAGNAVLNAFVGRWNSQGHRGDFIDQTDEQALYKTGFIQVERLNGEYDWFATDVQQMVSFMLELFGLDRQPDVHVLAAELAAGLDAGYRHGGYRVPWALTALRARKPGGLSL